MSTVCAGLWTSFAVLPRNLWYLTRVGMLFYSILKTTIQGTGSFSFWKSYFALKGILHVKCLVFLTFLTSCCMCKWFKNRTIITHCHIVHLSCEMGEKNRTSFKSVTMHNLIVAQVFFSSLVSIAIHCLVLGNMLHKGPPLMAANLRRAILINQKSENHQKWPTDLERQDKKCE